MLAIIICLFQIGVSGQSNTWSVKFSDAILSRYQPTINTMTNKGWEYSNGIILHGMEKIYNHTNDADYFNYIKAYVDSYVDASGNVTGLGKTVDKIQPGVLCLFLYEKTGQIKYKNAATNIKNYMFNSSNFYRTPDGGFWHKSEQTSTSYTYYHVMMVDGMYMLHPFLTKYATLFNEPSLYDEVTFQLLFMGQKAMPAPATLPRHAWEYYDYKTWSDPVTHQSTDVWSRGTGWYMMALVDVLEYLPTSHPKYNDVLSLFQRMASGVAANQHATTGLWYQVVDKPTFSGNWLESSGSGMFVYALKKGIDLGLLNSTVYLPVCQKGWTGLQTQIATYTDGMPQIKQFCVATGVVNSTSAYMSLGKANCPAPSGTQHPHGYCGILMAASEMEFPIVTIPVTGISLSPASGNVAIGSTLQLNASFVPADATNKGVTWQSDNSQIAIVSPTGLVTGIGAGQANIIAVSQDGGFRDTAQISVFSVPVTGVTVAPVTLSIGAGATYQLTPQVSPANATDKSIAWTSNNGQVATVNASGLVSGVAAGNAVITATTNDGSFTASVSVSVVQGCVAKGMITYERWNNISGTSVSNLTSNVNYPNNPASKSTLTTMEAPSNQANNYGVRISGFLCPPTTGNYTFWIAGDDNVSLFLSTDSTETNKTRIAYHNNYTSPRQWTKYSTQKSSVKSLIQGKSYYIEALMKDGSGNDNLAVGWLKPGQSGTVPSEIIPGIYLSPRNTTTPLSSVVVDLNADESDKDEEIRIFPNPSRSNFQLLIPETIINQNGMISILSAEGRKLWQDKRVLKSNELIQPGGLTNGTYFVTVVAGNKIYYKRLVYLK